MYYMILVTMYKKEYVHTNQREIILSYLKNNQGHFTASDVYAEVNKILPRISMATVYNVLRLLVKKGEIFSFHINDVELFEGGFYGVNGPHDHFVCSVCNTIDDVFVPDVRDYYIKKTSMAYPDKEMDKLSIVITGICKSCQKRGYENGKIR